MNCATVHLVIGFICFVKMKFVILILYFGIFWAFWGKYNVARFSLTVRYIGSLRYVYRALPALFSESFFLGRHTKTFQICVQGFASCIFWKFFLVDVPRYFSYVDRALLAVYSESDFFHFFGSTYQDNSDMYAGLC